MREQLLADWRSIDGKEELKLRRFDDSIYIVYYAVIFFVLTTPTSRKHLSRPFRTSTRTIGSTLTLSDDGNHLTLRSVNDKVIPKGTKDSATVVALLTKNARNPELFGEQIEFKQEK